VISIDTNLLLYAFNRDCVEHQGARAFLGALSSRRDVAIAELVLVELYVLLRNPAVVRTPLGPSEAAALGQAFRRHPRWALVDTSAVMDRVWAAAARPAAARRHIFDARLAHTLLDYGVTEFATRNTRDFEAFGFDRVFDPLRAA